MKNLKYFFAFGAIVASITLSLTTLPGQAAFSSKITNSSNSVFSSFQNCVSAYKSSGGSLAPLEAYAFSENNGTTTATNFITTPTNLGNGTYQNGHSTNNGSTAGNQPCRHDGGNTAKLNGTSQYVSTPKLSSSQLGSTGSTEIWFRTSTKSGVIAGIGDAQTGVSSQKDRVLFIKSTGVLVYGVYITQNCELTSTASVADGNWHHAVGTVVAGTAKLYLDGELIDTDNSSYCQSDTYDSGGYLHVGADYLVGWTNGPGNNNMQYFKGDIAYAAYYNYVLSEDQVKVHYKAATW